MNLLRLLFASLLFCACSNTPATTPPPNNEDSTQQRDNTKIPGYDSLHRTPAGGSMR